MFVPPHPSPRMTEVPATRLSVELHLAASVSVLRLRGELDADSVIALEAQIDQLSGAPCELVIVEMSLLTRIDDAGCRTIGTLAERLGWRGVRLSVAGAHGQVATSLAQAALRR